MYSSFASLKSNCKKDMSQLKEYRLALLGDSATQHLATALRGCGYEHGYRIEMFDADYNQIDAQILDTSGELYAHKADAALLFMCSEKLFDTWCDTPISERTVFAERMCEKIKGYWSAVMHNSKMRVLQFNFIEYTDGIFGSFGARNSASFVYQVKKLNLLLGDAAAETGAYIIDLNSTALTLGRDRIFDERMYCIAKMVLSTDALPYVAESVLKVIDCLNGSFKKCAVLDLDNTLWGGVIGDDGMDGIEIGELGRGHAFTDFQKWLKELKNRGVLLAVCSKNNEDTAKEPFERHPEMILHLDDFSIFVANWQDKASNIKYIQSVLNIGMDSLVFIDDNPFEREAVRSLIPEITVPEIPEDPASYVCFLKDQNLFETVSYSDADFKRTEQYRAEADRTILQQSVASFDDYLVSLEMVAGGGSFDKFHTPRIAQLTQRSNQFNLRTVRYTEDEIASVANDPNHITLYFTLKDRFGDNGLISVVILDKMPDSTLFISEYLMSCRVLKRTMEEFIINKIISVAAENGFKTVIGEYIPTAKNAMVKTIYPDHGFADIGGGRYMCDVEKYKPCKTFILDALGD